MKKPRNKKWIAVIAIIMLCTTYFVGFSDTRDVKADTLLAYVAPDGDCNATEPCFSTIQAAIDAVSPDAIIKVAEGTYTSNSLYVVYIDKPLSIIGGFNLLDWATPDPELYETIVDAQSIEGRRVIFIDSLSTGVIHLSNLTVSNGSIQPYTYGAGIYLKGGRAQLYNNKIQNNYVHTEGHGTGGGAGIFVEAGEEVVIDNNIFQGNVVDGYGLGSGIYIKSGNVTITSNDFLNNYAGSCGGGIEIYDENSLVTIDDNYFSENTGGDYGGGIHVRLGSVNISNNDFYMNHASFGGGVSIDGGTITIQANSFINNSSGLSGGAITLVNGSVVVDGNTILENSANSEGGGIFVAHGDFEILNNQIINNQAIDYGGGLSTVSYVGSLYLAGNIISGNVAYGSGGGINVGDGTISMERNIIDNNHAINGDGGGINIHAGNLFSQNDMVIDNQATWSGISLSGGQLVGKHMTIVNELSYGVKNDSGIVNLQNSILVSHTLAALSGANTIADYSLFFNNGQNCYGGSVCTNSVIGDPKFIDPSIGNYHIGAGSAANNVGIDVNVTDDIDLEPRPMQSGYDIGADELPPLAEFSTNSPIRLGYSVEFTNNSIYCDEMSFVWDFGDGQGSIDESPLHLYELEGIYSVHLQASCVLGEDNITKEAIVDGTGPYGTVDIIGIGRNVILFISAFDELTSVAEMQACSNLDFDGCDWIEYQNELNWDFLNTSTVFVRLKDEVGNISGSIIAERVWGLYLPSILSDNNH